MTLWFLRGQVGYVKERGIEVHALSSSGPELEVFAAAERVAVHSVEMARRITPIRDLASVGRICKTIRRIRPDIVHSHTPKGGLLGMVAAALTGTPVRIYHIRGLPLLGASGWKRRLLRVTEQIACRLANRVFCVSHSVKRIVLDEGLCSEAKIKVLGKGSGNGVDSTQRFNPARMSVQVRSQTRSRLGIPLDAIVIGFVGRIVGDKGMTELAEAWQRVRSYHPESHLLMVGPFEPQDPIPLEIESMFRSDSRVHLTGLDWNTPAFYSAMDMLVLPTYREGFPNVLLEAAAMELPVVATQVPGCVDAVEDDVTGILVPPKDEEALTAAIRRYIQDRQLRTQHGEAARERVRREFQQEVIWNLLYQEYLDLLRAKEGVAPKVTLSGSTA